MLNRQMSNLKLLTTNRSRMTIYLGMLLLVSGVVLWASSIYMLNSKEALLEQNNLTQEEYWSREASLNWWKNNYDYFVLVSIVLLILGVIVLVYPSLLKNKKSRRMSIKQSYVNTFSSHVESVSDPMDNFILEVILENKADSVEELAEIVKQKFNFSTEEALNKIDLLHKNGKILLKAPSSSIPLNFPRYVISLKNIWYWLTLLVSIATTMAALNISETDASLVFVRYALGYSFILFLPGFSLTKMLFLDGFDFVERIGLSLGLSIAMVCVVSFALNFTPSGISLFKLVASLLFVVLIFSSIGFIRGYIKNRGS